MDTPEKIIGEMNRMLDAEEFDRRGFMKLFKKIRKVSAPGDYIIDFTQYNEERLKILWKEKVRLAKRRDWEKAAAIRRMEEVCHSYIRFRNEEKFERSFFYYDNGFFCFICLGTARNDMEILSLIRK